MTKFKKGREITNVAVIILTYNEEENIGQLLDSVTDWAKEIFILDSYSTDKTVEIAKTYKSEVLLNKFENFSNQRNYALRNFSISSEWVLFLDADEWLPLSLKDEISYTISRSPPVQENGFYLSRRFLWMGSWIKRGYYPIWTLRLFRTGKGRCEDRPVNEHIIVDGLTAKLKHDYIHEDRKKVAHWIVKHIERARLEAIELFNSKLKNENEIDIDIFGRPESRTRWIRYKVWNRLPPLVRPFLYFIYRYIFRLGFLDGKPAFTYHFLQSLWFPMLIDIFYIELCMKSRKSSPRNKR